MDYLYNLGENLDLEGWVKENFPNARYYGYDKKIDEYVDECIVNMLSDGEVELDEVYDGDFFQTVMGMEDEMVYFDYELDLDLRVMFDDINEDACEANYEQFMTEAKKVCEGIAKYFGLTDDLFDPLTGGTAGSPGEQLNEFKEQVEDMIEDEEYLDDMIRDGLDSDTVRIFSFEYDAVEVLKAMDDIAYQEVVNEIVDNLIDSYLS